MFLKKIKSTNWTKRKWSELEWHEKVFLSTIMITVYYFIWADFLSVRFPASRNDLFLEGKHLFFFLILFFAGIVFKWKMAPCRLAPDKIQTVTFLLGHVFSGFLSLPMTFGVTNLVLGLAGVAYHESNSIREFLAALLTLYFLIKIFDAYTLEFVTLVPNLKNKKIWFKRLVGFLVALLIVLFIWLLGISGPNKWTVFLTISSSTVALSSEKFWLAIKASIENRNYGEIQFSSDLKKFFVFLNTGEILMTSLVGLSENVADSGVSLNIFTFMGFRSSMNPFDRGIRVAITFSVLVFLISILVIPTLKRFGTKISSKMKIQSRIRINTSAIHDIKGQHTFRFSPKK